MAKNSNAPCKNCSDRTIGCHGICKDYAEWCAEQKRIKEHLKETMPPIINRHNFVGLGFSNSICGKPKRKPRAR